MARVIFSSSDDSVVLYDDSTIMIEGKLYKTKDKIEFKWDMIDRLQGAVEWTLFDMTELKFGTLLILDRILQKRFMIKA